MVPSVETCFQVMEQYQMLDNIKAHSIVVAEIASFIARGLYEAGYDISYEKTIAGALLHDIGKTPSLESGEDHTEIGRRICLENQFVEISDIVKEHVRLKSYELNGDFTEKVVVYYADKRVNHDRIVSLDERLAYILERYAKNLLKFHGLIKANFEKCRSIEKRIFHVLMADPDSLAQLVKKENIRP
jgi:putative nucleotidyltransferase with HDIG domain